MNLDHDHVIWDRANGVPLNSPHWNEGTLVGCFFFVLTIGWGGVSCSVISSEHVGKEGREKYRLSASFELFSAVVSLGVILER